MNEIKDKIEGICQDCIYLNTIMPIIKELQQKNKTLKEKLDISVSDYDIVYDYFSQINKILNTELIEEIKNKIIYLQKRDDILTEFEKWLEETIKALKLSQQKILNFNISNSSKARNIREFNLRIITNSICLDKLQELKRGKNVNSK